MDALGIRQIKPARSEDESQKIITARTNYLSIADFTPREADVLAELQCGCSNKVIAGKLNLSGHTVKMHLQHIMRNCRFKTALKWLLGWAIIRQTAMA